MENSNDSGSNLASLQIAIERFAVDRDWDQFHTPKNLAMALSAEAGELLEVFQWLTPEASESPDEKTRARAGEEAADVLIYLLRFSQKLGIDLVAEAMAKVEKNAAKYPVEKAKGNATKYTEL